MNDTRYCWEQDATCERCRMELMENETIIFTLAQTNTMAVFALLISVLGSAINVLFLLSLVVNARARSQLTAPYIISLLLSDLLSSTIFLPMLGSTYYYRQTGSFCNIFPLVFYTCLGAFILSLMMLTVNRTCILLLQERAEKIMNCWVRKVTIFLCWTVPVFSMLAPLSGSYGKIGLNEYTQTCTVMEDDLGRNPENILINLFFFIPCTVMIICNIIMFVKIKLASSGSDKQIVIFITGLFFIFLFFVVTLIPTLILDHIDDCFKFPGAHVPMQLPIFCAGLGLLVTPSC